MNIRILPFLDSHYLKVCVATARRYFTCSVILTSVFLSGCMAAYNERTVTSPSGKYGTICHIRGALGRSYVAETKKKITVSIFLRGATPTLLFQKQYQIRGSAIEWESTWDDETHLSLVFSDVGPGADSQTQGARKRILRSIDYSFDSETGKVREESVRVNGNH